MPKHGTHTFQSVPTSSAETVFVVDVVDVGIMRSPRSGAMLPRSVQGR